jgi:hypothetical protein
VKISVSLPGEDGEFLDEYASAHALTSRSAAVHHAIHSLRRRELPDAYEQAWAEWESADDSGLWDSAAGDGL